MPSGPRTFSRQLESKLVTNRLDQQAKGTIQRYRFYSVGGHPMFAKLLDAMFGCRHARYSFPITVRAGARRTATAQRTGTYVACLDCGKEFSYDWEEMKVVRSEAREAAPSLVTKAAA